MATGLTQLGVHIFTGAKQLHFWEGSPSSSGGELMMIDMSPVNGPPQFDYDETGNARKPITFELESKIIGTDVEEQNAYMAQYARGTKFTSDQITGLSAITGGNVNFVSSEIQLKHNKGDESGFSTFSLKLHEVGPADGGTTPVGNVAAGGGA